jgi:hypothetical protein
MRAASAIHNYANSLKSNPAVCDSLSLSSRDGNLAGHNSCLHPAATFAAGLMLSASRGFASIVRLALVVAS